MSSSQQKLKNYLSIDLTDDTNISPTEVNCFYIDTGKCVNQNLPSFRSLISNSSRFSSKRPQTDKEKYIPEVEFESSSSVVFEDSQEILIVNVNKLHGSKNSFSNLHGINLKKIRAGRFSEYAPKKRLELQVDEDVQPEIASLYGSLSGAESRKRAVSYYNKNQEPNSIESEEEHSPILSPPEDLKVLNSPNLVESSESISLQNSSISSENFEVGSENPQIINDDLTNSIENISEVEIASPVRSVNSLIDINGTVFKYFEKNLLCQTPVLSFPEIIDLLVKLKFPLKSQVLKPNLTGRLLCCFARERLSQVDKEQIEVLLIFAGLEFEFSDKFHLAVLLATYCSVTGEKDWPGQDSDWLDMGFASEDLAVELKGQGLLGLLYMFFLSAFYPKFMSEMIGVSRYFSYEVFKVCKFFALDTIEILKLKLLNKYFTEEGKALEVNFLFFTGMVMDWFSQITKNKNFAETYKEVIKNAKKTPKLFITAAKNELYKS